MGVFEPSSFLRDAAVAAAHDLGLFDALAAGPLAPPALAAALKIPDSHRLRALLDVLAALGALTRRPGLIAARGRHDRPAIVAAGWGLLADVIRHDRPLPLEPADEARYHRHLVHAGAAAARELAPLLGRERQLDPDAGTHTARQLDLGAGTHTARQLDLGAGGSLLDPGGAAGGSLLDLGGGAGAYTAAFLDAHPGSTATLVDAPATVALAAGHLARFGARVHLLAGDARTAAVGEGHGAALLANVLHLHPADVCAELCAAAARAVAPGGLVAVVDLRIDEDRGGPIEGLLFALNMAIYTSGGDVHPASRIRGWLAAAGLVDIEARPLASAPEAMAVIGRRPRAGRAGAGTGVGTEAGVGTETRGGTEAGVGTETRAGTEAGVGTETRAGTEAETGTEPETRSGTEAEVAGELAASLAAAGEAAWRELAQGGALLVEADGPPRLSFPAPLLGALARAVAHERAEAAGGDAAASGRAAALVRHYTELMPRARVALLSGRAEPAASLFHTRLDWARLPRLGAAIDRLYALLAEAGAGAAAALGAPSPAAFRARTPTLAALYARTCYGGAMPLLYGSEADLAYFHHHADGLDLHAAIDRYLTAPMVHELCHFAPSRPALPLHLDECIAGWIGVHVHPELAYPAPGHDDAIFAAPWLSQVGQAIARAFGVHAVVQAHAGPATALPAAFTDAAARLGWDDWLARRTLHFLSDTLDPDPWVGLALAAGAGLPLASLSLAELARLPPAAFAALPDDPAFDLAIVTDGLRAMCLHSARVDGSFRTRTRLPASPITVDATAGRISLTHPDELLGVAPRYWLPPAVCARLSATGHTAYELHLGALAAIPEAAAAICAAAPADHADFALRPRTGRRAG